MYYYQSNLEIQQNRQAYESMYDPNHILVQIDKLMDWNRVYQLLEPFYPITIGRPTIDPLIFVKILMIQYLEGFRSVQFTCKQIQQHATYLWFLGISLTDKVPCHSPAFPSFFAIGSIPVYGKRYLIMSFNGFKKMGSYLRTRGQRMKPSEKPMPINKNASK
nr:transposase [Parageobacillus thermoglucosidasius]